MKKQYLANSTVKFAKSIWLFPTVLTLVLITLSVLNLSGSSVGIYYEFFYGDAKDASLIRGKPQSIRSDEWLVNTQKVLSQQYTKFDSTNSNMGLGEDVTFLYDIPSWDWSILLRPQNIIFLITPMSFAFAFHWWFIAYLLILSIYFFILVFLQEKFKHRILLAVILSIGFLFNPFIQWWYQAGTIAPIYTALFGITLAITILRSKSKRNIVVYSAVLSYVTMVFIATIYPPFQIPIAITSVFFLVGYFLENRKSFIDRYLRLRIVAVVMSLAVALAVIGAYALQHSSTISSVANTAYPGARVVESGGFSKNSLLASHLNGFLQSDSRSQPIFEMSALAKNKSEASGFILLFPLTIFGSLFLVYLSFKKKGRREYVLTSLLLCFVIFMAWLFVPNLKLLGSILMLNKVPLNRLIIGVGLLNLIMFVSFIKVLAENKTHKISRDRSIIILLLFTLFYTVTNLYLHYKFPGLFSFKEALLLALPLPVIYFLILKKRFVAGSVILLIITVLSSYKIHPVYRGTDILTNSKISTELRTINKKNQDKAWIVNSSIIFENLPLVNGLKTYSGVFLYPQINVWSTLDPKNSTTYNRYAHVTYSLNDTITTPVLTNPQEDRLHIKINPCDPFFKKNSIGFVLSVSDLGKMKCTTLFSKVDYPNAVFFIYEISL